MKHFSVLERGSNLLVKREIECISCERIITLSTEVKLARTGFGFVFQTSKPEVHIQHEPDCKTAMDVNQGIYLFFNPALSLFEDLLKIKVPRWSQWFKRADDSIELPAELHFDLWDRMVRSHLCSQPQ